MDLTGPADQFLAAAEAHYKVAYPDLICHRNSLFFRKEGVVLEFGPTCVLLVPKLSDKSARIADYRMLVDTMLKEPSSTLDKMNQTRAWKHLLKRVKAQRIDYGDPKLFELIDKALLPIG